MAIEPGLPAQSNNVVPPSAVSKSTLDENELRAKILAVFKKRPCDFQYKLFEAQQSGKNIISIARTGSGKTLTYLMPLILSKDSIIIIVTALNVLGEQFEREAQAAGYTALSVNGENESDAIFKDIKNLKYRVLIFSPDIMMKRGGRCETILWPAKGFVSKVQRIIFDEAHCVLRWGLAFRPEYKAATNITFYLPSIPIYLSSATMPPALISQLKQEFRLTQQNTTVFQRSNDRPNIAIVVRRMQHPQDSYEDLAFLVPKNWKKEDPLPPKFMVFFDNKKDAEGAAKFLRSRVSLELKERIPWFHAGMTKFFRAEQVVRLRGDDKEVEEVFGFSATDSGGLGLDVPNVDIVVQYKTTNNLDTAVQRFGRAARNVDLQGVAILIAEPHWFYDDLLRREQAREKRTSKRKAPTQDESGSHAPPAKRSRPTSNDTHSTPHIGEPSAFPSRPNTILSPSRRANQTTADRHLLASATDDLPQPIWPLAQDHSHEGESAVEADNLEIEEPELDGPSDEGETEGEEEGGEIEVVENTGTRIVVEEDEVMAMINKSVALRSKATKSTSGRTPRVPDRETCMFVNARFLAGERYCRRWHMNQYYANHLAPRDLKTCCKRCEEKPPPICCDLCDPEEVEKWIPVRNDEPPPRPRKTRRINVKDFTMTDSDKTLRQVLFRWRDETAKAQLGEYEEYGGDILMHYRIIERIVELASVDKLKTLKHLQDQTSWAWTTEYGEEVLELVRKHAAERVVQRDNTAPAAETVQGAQAAPRRVRASPTCSACGEVGHRKNSGTCPVNIAARRAAASSSENRPPQ